MIKTLLITITLISSGQSAIAATTNSQMTTATQQSKDTATNSSASKTFKLSATKVNMGLEQLNDVGLDLKNVLTSTRHLYDEVMIQPVTVITEPEMIAAVVINIKAKDCHNKMGFTKLVRQS